MRPTNLLTDTAIRAARPRQKSYKLSDGEGLFLLVNPDGSRWWRLKYFLGGVEKGLSLGVYPTTTLKAARRERVKSRQLVAAGTDPSDVRKAEKRAQADSFKAVADEWIEKQRSTLEADTVARLEAWLKVVNKPLGTKPIAKIEPPELLAVLRRIEHRGKLETAHRTLAACGRIFRYAIATGRATRDISADLRGALEPAVKNNFAAITDPRKVGVLLRAIDSYSGQPPTEYALKLAPLVFVRPGELRGARWSEFDLKGAEWRIPAARMKMDREHVVPLSRQAVALLEALHELTGDGDLLFPGLRTPSRPISENTVNAALRGMGFKKDEMTGHGFRSMASTLLNEQGFAPDVIELQLAHQEKNKTRAAYNRAQRLEERRRMMQAWADYLDGLKAGAKVVGIKRKAK